MDQGSVITLPTLSSQKNNGPKFDSDTFLDNFEVIYHAPGSQARPPKEVGEVIGVSSLSTLNVENSGKIKGRNTETFQGNFVDEKVLRESVIKELGQTEKQKKEAIKSKKNAEILKLYVNPGTCEPSHRPPPKKKRNSGPFKAHARLTSALELDSLSCYSNADHTVKYLISPVVGDSDLLSDLSSHGVTGVQGPIMPYSPALPDVDKYVQNSTVKYNNLVANLQHTRNIPLVKVPDGAFATPKKVARGEDQFTVTELKLFMKHVSKETESDNISYDSLEKIFRKLMRTRAASSLESEGKELMKKLRKILIHSGITLLEWYNGITNSKKKKLTRLALSEGIQEACYEIQAEAFSQEEIITLVRYMDPNGDEVITFDEIFHAFKRSVQSPKTLEAENIAAMVMEKLIASMAKKKYRLLDLFKDLDKDKSGGISLSELQAGLLETLKNKTPRKSTPPDRKRRPQSRERPQSKSEQMRKESLKLTQDMENTVEARITEAHASGAYPALLKIDMILTHKNISLQTLFQQLAPSCDWDGSGRLDAKEMSHFFARIGISMSKSEALNVVAFLDKTGDGKVTPSEIEVAVHVLRYSKNKKRNKTSKLIGVANKFDDLIQASYDKELHEEKAKLSEKYWRELQAAKYKVKYWSEKRILAQDVRYDGWLDSYDKRFRQHQLKLYRSKG